MRFYGTVVNIFDQLQYLLFFLALMGGACSLCDWIKKGSPSAALKCFPVLLCLGAFSGFFLASYFKPAFGHGRNFFYLLGPYIILISTFVCALPVGDTIRALVFTSLCVILTVAGIGQNLSFLDAMYVNRAKISYAKALDAQLIVIEQAEDLPIQFGYHSRRESEGKQLLLLARDEFSRQLPSLLQQHQKVGWVAEDREGKTYICPDENKEKHSYSSFPFSFLLPRTREIVSCVLTSVG